MKDAQYKEQQIYIYTSLEDLAVSSSPRPWMDVFALPEKLNMAVTESDPDTRSEKCP